MTNAFILCDLVWKVQKSHAANREGSFKLEFLFDGTVGYSQRTGWELNYIHNYIRCW